MDASSMNEATVPAVEAGEESPAADLFRSAKRQIKEVVDLIASETRLAALSALTMVLLVILSAASLVVAWGLFVASLLYGIAASGVPWPVAAIALAIVHAALAFVCWQMTIRLSRNLTLPAVRHVLAAGGEHGPD
jgi:hypothetical protein